MSQPTHPVETPQPTPVAPPAPVKPKTSSLPSRIFLISYPKIVFMYPTLVMAFIAGLLMSFNHQTLDAKNTEAVVLAVISLGVLATNLVVLAFDFPRTSSLTLFFIIVALVLACALVVVLKPELVPHITAALKHFHPLANATFYWAIVAMLALVTVAAIIYARFDCWEARPNELLHRKGLWGDVDRFPAPGLRIDKEISDVFEYVLLRSGRLVLHISTERRAVVLDNIPFIDKKEYALTQMLGTLQVEVRTDADPTE